MKNGDDNKFVIAVFMYGVRIIQHVESHQRLLEMCGVGRPKGIKPLMPKEVVRLVGNTQAEEL